MIQLGVRGLLLLVLLAACTGGPRVPEGPRPGEGRVLILALPKSLMIERLVATLSAGGLGFPPLPPVAADIEYVVNAPEAVAAVRKHAPLEGRYRAIYAETITFARGAQTVTSQLPIVFDGVDDPVRRCVVDSLRHPGRNATGYMHYLHDDEFKLMQLLHDGFPHVREVLFLMSAHNLPPPNCDPQDSYWTQPPPQTCTPGVRPLDAYIQSRVDGAELVAQAVQLGLRLRFVVVCDMADLAALARWGRQQPAAGWMVPWHGLFDENRALMTEALNPTGMPAAYPHHGFTRAGGLMSMTPYLDVGPDRASWLALAQVLGGVDPATLPVQSPRGFSIMVNARTAARMQPPPSLAVLRRADQILR